MYSRIKEYIEFHLSKKRLEHSISTSIICSKLCVQFGIDENKGRIAGIAHDISRETVVTNKMINSLHDNSPVCEEETNNHVLLHGRIGAAFLMQYFNLEDNEILQAVRWHTTGHPDMGDLGKILYIADYIEPGRMFIDNSFRNKIKDLELGEMTMAVLKEQIKYLRSCGCTVTEPTLNLYRTLLLPKYKSEVKF
jgi:predicted HD superfamily hydrolase involved in NAD metabolism